MLINVSPLETRVALLNNGVLQELFVERDTNEGHVGNIYCGKVVRVLPGMQAAFVEIGFERTAFLHIKDIDLGALNKPPNAEINTVLRQGQLLNVQVMKDPLGSKGARLTTYFSLSSHYLVYMPQADNIGISQRIEDSTERNRLHTLIEDLVKSDNIDGGFIVRTVAEHVDKRALQADVSLLGRQWRSTHNHKAQPKAGMLLYCELPMVQRVLRDVVLRGLERVLVDDQAVAAELIAFANEFVIDAASCIQYYEQARPIFDLRGIEDQITTALARRVDLASGGYVIFDQTEAMTTVDVNTGAFVGKKNLEDTAYQTNLEAVTVIARQLCVRNLGGMIIIDFIDMPQEEHRNQINLALDNVLANDRVKTSRYELKELGLAALTRKRTRESLEHILCDSCPVCDGLGRVRSVETVINDLFREIQRAAAKQHKKQLLVVVASNVGTILLDAASQYLSDLERELGVTIQTRIDTQYARGHYDVASL